MTATKAQIIEFILEEFEGPDHELVSKTKLESFKKAELEEFIEKRNCKDRLYTWQISNS